jgi:drug/metabolite transporter (DMT)-like permease
VKTKVILAVTVAESVAGNLALSYGMKRVGDLSQLPPAQMAVASIQALFNPWVAVGVLLLISWFLTYSTALSWADLSYVVPTTAIGYVITALLSHLLLHEALSPARWAGTVLIASGVILVARTDVSTAEPAEDSSIDAVPGETAS